MPLYTSQKATHCVSIAARSVASRAAGSGDADASVVAGSGGVVTTLDAADGLGLVDTSATDGLAITDDPEPLEPVGASAVLDVQPAINTAVAVRHPAMRHSESRDLFTSRSPRRQEV